MSCEESGLDALMGPERREAIGVLIHVDLCYGIVFG